MCQLTQITESAMPAKNEHFPGVILKPGLKLNKSISFKLWYLRKVIPLGNDHKNTLLWGMGLCQKNYNN